MTLIDKPDYEVTLRRRVARRLAVMPKPGSRPGGRHPSDWFHLDEVLGLRADTDPDLSRLIDPYPAGAGIAGIDALMAFLIEAFRTLHGRLDTLDRHAADLMFLQLSAQEVLIGKRRPFSRRSQSLIVRVLGGEPYQGRCPCCMEARVLTEGGQPASGAEFDHFFHCSFNKPEFGWLICKACHDGLTHDGYLARFARVPAFRSFQAAVLRQRRRAQMRPGDDDGGC